MFLSLLYPQNPTQYEEYKLSDYTFVKALQIDQMVKLRDARFYGTQSLTLDMFFTKSPEVIKYRLDIVDDLLENEGLYKMFDAAIPIVRDIIDIRRVKESYEGNLEGDLYAIKTIDSYMQTMQVFYSGLKNAKVKSEGLKALKEYVVATCEAEEYKNLQKRTAELYSSVGNIKSITIGVNMDATFQVTDAGILSINQKEVKGGDILCNLMSKEKPAPQMAITRMFYVARAMDQTEKDKLNYGIAQGIATIFKKTISSWGPIIKQFYAQSTDFLVNLSPDFRFYVAGVKFIKEMREAGYAMSKPEIMPVEDKVCEMKGLYNAMIPKKLEDSEVVSNDVVFDDKGMFYIITGPNHGGKSIFLYSVGMAQALAQLGLYVPADSAKISPVANIFTHFPSSDEDNYGKGRLESECARLSEILFKLDEYSLLLLDEAFSSTSVTEASYIVSEVLTGIGTIGCRGLFVTHIHEIPMKINEYNSHPGNRTKFDCLTAQMKNKEDGTRSYRLERVVPDGLSYAKDIAKKYGLELDQILNKKMM